MSAFDGDERKKNVRKKKGKQGEQKSNFLNERMFYFYK